MTPARAVTVSPSATDASSGGPSTSPVMCVRPANASASVPAPGRPAYGPVEP